MNAMLQNQGSIVPYAEIGSAMAMEACNKTLYVCPNGNNSDGKTWRTAYQTLKTALDAASTDANDLTLIQISPIDIYYDMDTAGDPTYTGNYVLIGSHRNWAKIVNNHASSTSVLKFTGKVCMHLLNINLGTKNNGIIMSHGGWRVLQCQFVGEDLAQAAMALSVENGTTIKHGIIDECHFDGHASYMTALHFDNAAHSHTNHCHIHDCLQGVHIENSGSDNNIFNVMDFDDCGTAIKIDAGNRNHFSHINFDNNTINVVDTPGDSIFEYISGRFSMCFCPTDMTGIQLTAGANPNEWGSNVEVRSAAVATKPFRVVGYMTNPTVSQIYTVRFSADAGTSYFDEIMVYNAKQEGSQSPSGTEFIFNSSTQIVASAKAESGGSDTINVWLKVQEI